MVETKAEVRAPGAYKPGQKQIQGLGICIYGIGGSGKTTLAGTMPGRGLVIDVPQVEGGDFVLADKADRIDVVSIEKWNELDEQYHFLRTANHPYKWVAIDSLTAMTELAKRKAIKDRDQVSLSADPHTISLQEWGKVGRLVGEMVYQFRLLPIHTIWIAQERKFGGDEDTGSDAKLGPDTSPGALQMLLPSLMLVGRLSVEMGDGGWERHLRIGPHPKFYTKARMRPDKETLTVVRNPDLGVLLKYMVGSGPKPELVDEMSVTLIG